MDVWYVDHAGLSLDLTIAATLMLHKSEAGANPDVDLFRLIPQQKKKTDYASFSLKK